MLTLVSVAAVVVGSLPALKILVNNRPATKHSLYGSAGGVKKQQYSHGSGHRSKNLPMGSISSDKRSIKAHRTDTSDSQEEILQPDNGRFVVVKHDIVSRPRILCCEEHQSSNFPRDSTLTCLVDGLIR